MITHKTMQLILAWTLLSFLLIGVKGVPYGSINDLYDTNYEYEFGDNQAREEVLITKTPQFLSQPLELVVNEGHTVKLPCLVDRLDGFVLLWRKNDQIISVGGQILDRSKTNIQLEEEENGNTLVISLADHTDEAEYVCSVSAYRKTEIRHNVRIRVEPVITTSPKDPLIVNEGDSATLSCHLLSGTPIPDMKWRKCDGGSFSTGEDEILKDVIKFESVTRDDSGCYVCEADNGFADEPVNSKAMLVVEYPPSVHIQKTEESADLMTITCTVDSQPGAEITWLKDGKKIEAETERFIINKSSSRSTINLIALDGEDLGNYTCAAENKLGIVEDSVNISGKESDADYYENIEDNSESSVHFENTIHKSIEEEGSGLNIHEYETKPEYITDYIITHMETKNEKVIKGPQQKKSSGKIYFARTPSLYTLPKEINKPFSLKKNSLFLNTPTNVNEFLRLLRIYHHSHVQSDVTDSNFNEEDLTQEKTTDSHLLRSTHEYLGHLNAKMQVESEAEFSGSEIQGDIANESMKQFTASDNESEKHMEEEKRKTKEEKALTIESNDFDENDEKATKNAKREKAFKQPLLNVKGSNVNGRYLEENEILTNEATLEEQTDLLHKSNINPLIRGHHSIQNNLESMKAKDIIVNFNTEPNLCEQNDEEKLTDEIKKSIPKQRKEEKNEVQEESGSRASNLDYSSHFPNTIQETGVYGTRYIKDVDSMGVDDEKTEDKNEAKIPVLRGQHSLQIKLNNFVSHEPLNVFSLENEQETGDSLILNEPLDEHEREVKHSGTTEKDNDQETIHYKLTENTDNVADKVLIGSRYLKEDQNYEETGEILEDQIKTQNQALRGQHSFQTSLGETNQGEQTTDSKQLIPSSENEANLEKKVMHVELEYQTQYYEKTEKEDLPGAKEKMYPEEIMNIEKMYFTKITHADLPKNVPSHPLLPHNKVVEPKERKMILKSDEMNENDATSHPLQVAANLANTHTEVQFRGEHLYEKGLKDVTGDQTYNAENEQNRFGDKFGKSKPMRGDHSYNKLLEEEEDATEKIKRRLGPHPFRGLRFRKP